MTAQQLYEAIAQERAARYPGEWAHVAWDTLTPERQATWALLAGANQNADDAAEQADMAADSAARAKYDEDMAARADEEAENIDAEHADMAAQRARYEELVGKR